jgi:ATP-dependent Clp protease protease subunit
MSENNKPNLPFFLKDSEVASWAGRWHAHRRILVSGELTNKSIERTSLELIKLGYMNDDEPITMMIQSVGGTVIPTQQLGDVINFLNCPVDALVIGDCTSMGVDLVQMCRKRLLLPNSRMLVHYVRHGQTWICDDPDQVDGDIAYFRERIREIAENRILLYQRRTGLSRERLGEMFRHGEVHQAYFSARQCIELNLADEIVTDFKLFPK